ncbi:MAG: hypothetical protein K2G78_04070 [Muribaculaceae bacterium]|nr:hypothetical protein [Muribaculaceae bacterium]
MKKFTFILAVIICALSVQTKAQTLKPYFEEVCKLPEGSLLYENDAKNLIANLGSDIPFDNMGMWCDLGLSPDQKFSEIYSTVAIIINRIPGGLLSLASFNEFNGFQLFCAPITGENDKVEVLIAWSIGVYGDVMVMYGYMNKFDYARLQAGEINMSYSGPRVYPMPEFEFTRIFKGTSIYPEQRSASDKN